MKENFINVTSGLSAVFTTGCSIDVLINKATPFVSFFGLCAGVVLTIIMIVVQLKKLKNDK